MEIDNKIIIKNLIHEGLSIISHMSIRSDSPAGSNTGNLKRTIKQLFPLIANDFPLLSNILSNAETRLIQDGIINAFFFGDIRTTINILSILYPLQEQGGYKIFISHSSDDETIVNAFIKDILIVGCGFRRTEIFCTLDHTVIRTGDDFRNEIIENMKRCDYILCMISDNYRKSEVCQNELGAAWAMTGKRVLPFKFPNINFKEIGFLNVVKQTADISEKSKLDELYDEHCQF